MLDKRKDPAQPWTPGPWVSMAGTEDDYAEVEGMGAIRVEGAYRCDGYPVTVAAVVSTDEAGWEGIGCTYATARLVALAPEMAGAILAADGCDLRTMDALYDLADRLRALSPDLPDAPTDTTGDKTP